MKIKIYTIREGITIPLIDGTVSNNNRNDLLLVIDGKIFVPKWDDNGQDYYEAKLSVEFVLANLSNLFSEHV